MKSIRTHYDNLQVSRNADDGVIKAAYRALSQKYHPDKNQDNHIHATKVMKIINEAYTVLSNPDRRLQHDKWIKEKESEFQFKENQKKAVKDAEREKTMKEERSTWQEQQAPNTSYQSNRNESDLNQARERFFDSKNATPDVTKIIEKSSSKLKKWTRQVFRFVFYMAMFLIAVVVLIGLLPVWNNTNSQDKLTQTGSPEINVQATVNNSIATSSYDALVTNIEQKYPELNPGLPQYRDDLVQTIRARKTHFENQGSSQTEALQKAILEFENTRNIRVNTNSSDSNYQSDATINALLHQMEPEVKSAEELPKCIIKPVMSDLERAHCHIQLPIDQ